MHSRASVQSAYARCTEAIVRAYADLTYSVLENVMCVLLLMLIDEGKMFWVNACIAHLPPFENDVME